MVIDKKVLDGLFEGKKENFKAASQKAGAETIRWKELSPQKERGAHIRKVLAEHFNGNIEAYNASIAETRRKKLDWQDVLAHAITLPEYKAQGTAAIVTLLGYLPLLSATVKEEVFIRAFVLQHQSGLITDGEYFDQCEGCVKHIRNFEVGLHGWAAYDAETLQQYEHYLPQWKQAVRDRLKKFLGYVPKPQHSAGMEILLREEMASDHLCTSDKPMVLDHFAINVIKYRETLLEHGKDAADASPLYAQQINARFHGQ